MSRADFAPEAGEVYTAGRNHVGQCGTGDAELSHVARVPLMTGVTQCAAGDAHSLFVCSDGRVFGCGATQYGQLGTAFPNLDSHVPGQALRTPQQLAAIPPIQRVTAGACHSVLLDSKSRVSGTRWHRDSTRRSRSPRAGQGRAWSMGWNGYHQLGRRGAEHVPALVAQFQLDDAALSVHIEHVFAALWSTIFVTRKWCCETRFDT